MTTTPLWPDDYGVLPDHCAAVVAGSYDVPFNPATPPVILDIGANIGAFVRFAVKRWPGCTIHAFEPQPRNFELLLRTVATWGAPEKVLCYQVAVGTKSGRVELYLLGKNCGEWALVGDGEIKQGSIPVKMISAADLPKADILKIDVEGAECDILATLGEDRIREFSAVMLELHSAEWIAPVIHLFTKWGFTLTKSNRLFEHRCELNFLKPELLRK